MTLDSLTFVTVPKKTNPWRLQRTRSPTCTFCKVLCLFENASIYFDTHDNIHEGLKHAQNEGLTWNDLDLDSVAWSILFLVERVPDMDSECGKKTSYDEIAKIICRMVFPPDILVQLKSGSRTLQGNENG
jgi:hypothetical protein